MRKIQSSDPQRRRYVAKVKRFARSKAGLRIIEKLAPDIAAMIKNNPEYLDVPQVFNDHRLSGCYLISIYDQCFYTGESGNALFRICEHVYNYCNEAESFGHKYDASIPAKFEVFAWGVADKEMRELIEDRVIDIKHPLLQYTDKNAPEYGKDKAIPEGETRETMRKDICVSSSLKIKRFNTTRTAYYEKINDLVKEIV